MFEGSWSIVVAVVSIWPTCLVQATNRFGETTVEDQWNPVEVRRSLESSRAETVSIFDLSRPGVFITIYNPRFQREIHNQWMFLFETFKDEGIDIYMMCKRSMDAEILFTCLSIDDVPEFQHDRVTPENFPWDFFLLERAAVRASNGDWIERVREVT